MRVVHLRLGDSPMIARLITALRGRRCWLCWERHRGTYAHCTTCGLMLVEHATWIYSDGKHGTRDQRAAAYIGGVGA